MTVCMSTMVCLWKWKDFLDRVRSLLPPCGSYKLTSGHQPWWPVILPLRYIVGSLLLFFWKAARKLQKQSNSEVRLPAWGSIQRPLSPFIFSKRVSQLAEPPFSTTLADRSAPGAHLPHLYHHVHPIHGVLTLHDHCQAFMGPHTRAAGIWPKEPSPSSLTDFYVDLKILYSLDKYKKRLITASHKYRVKKSIALLKVLTRIKHHDLTPTNPF